MSGIRDLMVGLVNVVFTVVDYYSTAFVCLFDPYLCVVGFQGLYSCPVSDGEIVVDVMLTTVL